MRKPTGGTFKIVASDEHGEFNSYMQRTAHNFIINRFYINIDLTPERVAKELGVTVEQFNEMMDALDLWPFFKNHVESAKIYREWKHCGKKYEWLRCEGGAATATCDCGWDSHCFNHEVQRLKSVEKAAVDLVEWWRTEMPKIDGRLAMSQIRGHDTPNWRPCKEIDVLKEALSIEEDE